MKLPRFLSVCEAGVRLRVELPWLLGDPADFAATFGARALEWSLGLEARTVAEGRTEGRIDVDLRGEAAGVLPAGVVEHNLALARAIAVETT